MAGYSVKVQGIPQVLSALDQISAGASEIGLRRDSIVSDVAYAYGQNYGFYRNGRLARRAGPTLFFEAGAAAIEASAYDQLAAALPYGRGAVRSAWAVLIRRGVTEAQRTAPVKTGTLRGSIHAA
jgi:hypothetical protein